METGPFDFKKSLQTDHSSSKRKRVESDLSINKLILFFLLAIIPALLLGYIIIYGAYKLETQQNKKQQLYDFYQRDKQDYWQYQEQIKKTLEEEEGRRKNIWGAMQRVNQEMENQRESIRFQQEQLKAEQQRIQMLLKEFKSKKPL